MTSIRQYLDYRLLVFLFCAAVMFGPSMSTLLSYDPAPIGSTDTRTYLGLARFQLKQNPKRKYRVIVPAAAAAINAAGGFVWKTFAPKNYKEDFSLVFSFFIVNLLLMSLFGVLIYRYIQSFGFSPIISLAALLPILTCRYTFTCVGTPLADSIYFVVLALTLLGIRTQNHRMLIIAIFLGPFAKEAFIFLAPLIFFFSTISKLRQLIYFIASAGIVFGFRYFFDKYAGLPVEAGLKADVGHIENITTSLRNLFTGKTVLSLISTFGLWIFFIAFACIKKPFRLEASSFFSRFHLAFLATVVVQLLLSGAYDRMLYLAMPLYCVVFAASLKYSIRQREILKNG